MKKKLLLMCCILCLSIGIMAGCKNNSTQQKETVKETDSISESNVSEESDKYKGKKLKVGITADYEPWCYKEGEEIKGIDTDVLQEVAERMGFDGVEFEITSFDGLFGLLDAKKVDTVAKQISITPKRLEKYTFSDPYAYNPYKVLVHENNNDIHSINDLFGHSLVTKYNNSGYEYITKFKEENDPEDKIEVVITEEQIQGFVAAEKADACFYSEPTYNFKQKQAKLPIKLVGEPLFTETNGFPFSKDADANLIEDFNAKLNEMREDGTLAEIFNLYLGQDLSKDIK